MQNIGADNAGDAFYRYKMPKLVSKVTCSSAASAWCASGGPPYFYNGFCPLRTYACDLSSGAFAHLRQGRRCLLGLTNAKVPFFFLLPQTTDLLL